VSLSQSIDGRKSGEAIALRKIAVLDMALKSRRFRPSWGAFRLILMVPFKAIASIGTRCDGVLANDNRYIRSLVRKPRNPSHRQGVLDHGNPHPPGRYKQDLSNSVFRYSEVMP